MLIPPIKINGIKTKLVPTILQHLPDYSGKWVEPFFGSGVVGFNSNATSVIANDCNHHIMRFYLSIQQGYIDSYSVEQYLIFEGNRLEKSGVEHYNYIRDRFNTYWNPLDFLFLSRAGFNGLMRFNKQGKFNVPFCHKPQRYRQSYITKILNQVDKVKKVLEGDWILYSGDFEDTLKLLTPDDFCYCDPPYYERSSKYLGSDWAEESECRLYCDLVNSNAKFMLSTWWKSYNRENPMVKKYWSKYNIIPIDHKYFVSSSVENTPVVEVLITNY